MYTTLYKDQDLLRVEQDNPLYSIYEGNVHEIRETTWHIDILAGPNPRGIPNITDVIENLLEMKNSQLGNTMVCVNFNIILILYIGLNCTVMLSLVFH